MTTRGAASGGGDGRGPARQPGGSHRQQEPDGRGGLSYPKAIAILVVAVVLGVYLLSLGGRGPVTATGASSSTSTTAPPGSTTSTTAAAGAKASAAVKVLVANASHTNGVAGYYTSKVAAAGWGTLTPLTANTAESTSSVYYAAGQQANATAVATLLGVPASAVQPLGATVPVSGTTGAAVVVVVGSDLAAQVPATSTTAG